MAHNSPETQARLALARQSPIIGGGQRPLTEAEKAEALKDAEDNQVLKSLQQEQRERDEIVRLLIASPDFDLGAALEAPEAFAKKALALAEVIVSESNRRDYAAIASELNRLGAPMQRGLRLICERHGIEVPEKSLSVVAPVG